LVTGASSGIGESFAKLLAARGSDLVLVARREDLLRGLADELTRRYGVAAEVLRADLTDEAGLAAVEERLRSEPVELLVNNAGYGALAPFADASLADQLKEIDLDVTAVVRLAHAAVGEMVSRGRGGILNVASVAGFAPSPGAAVYGASKAFVASFSESLHAEVARSGVHVTALAPGFTRTADTTERELLWLRREDVAREGLEAVEAGRSLCVPGLQYKAAMQVLRTAPRSLLRGAAVRMWRRAADSAG
jgi:short-subunit dehydrogenase